MRFVNKKYTIIIYILLFILVLSGCRAGEERFELTNYLGKSVSTFRKRTGLEIVEQSNRVFGINDMIQLIARDDNIASVTILKEGEELTLFGIGIGMSKEEAEASIKERFGEDSRTINSSNHSITYRYLYENTELYISYDIDTEQVVEISYYQHKPITVPRDIEHFDGEIMSMIGDTPVYYNEAMVYLKSIQETYEAEYGNQIWEDFILEDGSTFGDLIKEEVINQITELKIIVDQAKAEGIELTEEEKAEAKEYARRHYEGLTNQDIDRYVITEELLARVYSDNMLAEKFFETVTINVDNNVSDLEAQQITIQHILIYQVKFNDDGTTEPYSAEDRETALNKALAILEEARDTEDFYSLAEVNSEERKIERTFGRGQGPEEYSDTFEQAAFSLKTGEVSDLVTTDYGWHILYCVTDFNEDATIQRKEEIIDQRRTETFAELYSQWSANYDVVVNTEAWNSISFTN